MQIIFFVILGLILGAAVSFAFQQYAEKNKISQSKTKSDELLEKAKKESEELLRDSKREANEIARKAEKLEEKILEREEKIEKKLEDIEEKQEKIIARNEELKEEKIKLQEKREELDGKLAEIAKLTQEEAKTLYLKQVSEICSDEATSLIEKHKQKITEEKNEVSREILIRSMQQYAGDVTSEVTTTIIELPNDDLKGKLIGKEGRNIVAFEKATQVALIIDDTPDSVFISGFDLFKRYIAKKSLEKLLEDGRIQPARIEEVVEKTSAEADILLKEIGRKTLDDLGISGIPEAIVPLIGKLRFRSSYGQNILKHSMEVAIVAEGLAKEFGLNQELLKKGGLLHDLGKALDHDIEGTHPEIGAKVGRKYGLSEDVVDMIENHHGEHFSISLNAAIVQIADAVSSVRPGARRENIEQYIKRVKEMEALVQSFSGVSKAYAISAGREVRVFVDAKTVSDIEALEVAKNIANDIHEKLNYPGEVKVNLIREMRVIEYAK